MTIQLLVWARGGVCKVLAKTFLCHLLIQRVPLLRKNFLCVLLNNGKRELSCEVDQCCEVRCRKDLRGARSAHFLSTTSRRHYCQRAAYSLCKQCGRCRVPWTVTLLASCSDVTLQISLPSSCQEGLQFPATPSSTVSCYIQTSSGTNDPARAERT